MNKVTLLALLQTDPLMLHLKWHIYHKKVHLPRLFNAAEAEIILNECLL